jgi:hypothetical protein
MHAPSQEKSDDLRHFMGNYSRFIYLFFFYFPQCYMQILLGDFNAKLVGKDIFKPTVGSVSLHQDSNDTGVRIVNFATSKQLLRA